MKEKKFHIPSEQDIHELIDEKQGATLKVKMEKTIEDTQEEVEDKVKNTLTIEYPYGEELETARIWKKKYYVGDKISTGIQMGNHLIKIGQDIAYKKNQYTEEQGYILGFSKFLPNGKYQGPQSFIVSFDGLIHNDVPLDFLKKDSCNKSVVGKITKICKGSYDRDVFIFINVKSKDYSDILTKYIWWYDG